MIQRQRVNIKLVFVQNASTKAAREFLDLESELKLQIARPESRIQKIPQSFGPEHIQRLLPPVEVQRADQPRDSIQMVAVKVTDEDAVNPASFDPRPHDLQLRAF